MKEKAIIINGILKQFKVVPSKVPGLNFGGNLQNLNHMELFNLGFRDVHRPPLQQNQKYCEPLLPSDYNEDVKQFIYRVEDIPPLTEEEIFQQDLQNTKVKYEFHKSKGWQSYQDFRANIVYKIEQGELTETQAFEIEDYLSVGYEKIANTGDWKTALYKLQQITLPENSFVEPYLNEAIQNIQAYIFSNYES